MDTSHGDQYTFMIISRSVLLIMRNVSDKNCRENQTTHFMCNNFFFVYNHAVYGVMWKNTVEPGRPQMTVWHMCNAYLITKATNPYSECIILIAFPRQKWLHERASVLTFVRYLVHCLSYVGLSLWLPGNVLFAFEVTIALRDGVFGAW
jgi:hypothetical protein